MHAGLWKRLERMVDHVDEWRYSICSFKPGCCKRNESQSEPLPKWHVNAYASIDAMKLDVSLFCSRRLKLRLHERSRLPDQHGLVFKLICSAIQEHAHKRLFSCILGLFQAGILGQPVLRLDAMTRLSPTESLSHGLACRRCLCMEVVACLSRKESVANLP